MRAITFQAIIGWASIPLLAALIGILIWRKAFREFPYFLTYLIIGELIVLVRFCFYNPYSLVYFYLYWTTDLLIAIAALLATYELFVRRLFPLFYAVRFYRILFPASAIVVVLLAAPAALQLNQLWIIIRTIHVLDVVRAAILAFFVGLMVFMGRQWGRYEFGIALGLAIQAAALLVTSANWVKDSSIHALATLLPVTGYDIACLIWLITFSRTERPKIPSDSHVGPDILEKARKWEETLKDSVAGKKHSQ